MLLPPSGGGGHDNSLGAPLPHRGSWDQEQPPHISRSLEKGSLSPQAPCGLALSGAAPGGLSRQQEEAGSWGAAPGGREGGSGLPENWSTVGVGAADSRSQEAGDGDPGSHAPPGKAGAPGYRVGLVGAKGWGHGSVFPVFLDSQTHLSVPVALTIGPSSLSDPVGSFALSALTARVSRDVWSWVSLEASGAGT